MGAGTRDPVVVVVVEREKVRMTATTVLERPPSFRAGR